MILAQAAPTRFTFMPIDKKSFCLFSSRVLRKPIIYKVALDEHDVFARSFSVDINNSGHHHRSLGPSARFIYMIREHQRGTRERWISPLKFECEPRWFCQRRRGLPQIRWETILLLMQSRMAISTSKFRIVFHKTKDESEEHKEIVDGKSRKRASQLLLSNIAVCR